jgi:drug/metabolite transporter (DMT)-like permease
MKEMGLGRHRERWRYTAGGMLAAVLWSTAVAAGRRLTEIFGGLSTVALVHVSAAMLSLLYLAVSPAARRAVIQGSKRYILGCGALFILYVQLFYRALALASSREQVLLVGIINYLWPSLSLLLSVPLLGHRTSLPAMLAANLVAVLGVTLALLGGGIASGSLTAALAEGWQAYLPAFGAALCWGLYNNLSRRWGGADGSGAIPVFIIATALLMSPQLFLIRGNSSFDLEAAVLLIFVALFPTFLAYFLWDLAERRGHHSTVNALAYLIPVASTLITSLYLHLSVPALTWIGCVMVIIGAAMSRLVILDREPSINDEEIRGLRAILRSNLGLLSGLTGRRSKP